MYKILDKIKSQKTGFTLIEVMLLLVVISLIFASSASIITRKHKLKPHRSAHGIYVCYRNNDDTLHEVQYSGSQKILENDQRTNAAFTECSFTPPTSALYLHIQLIGGGGAGGNANQLSEAKEIIDSEMSIPLINRDGSGISNSTVNNFTSPGGKNRFSYTAFQQIMQDHNVRIFGYDFAGNAAPGGRIEQLNTVPISTTTKLFQSGTCRRDDNSAVMENGDFVEDPTDCARVLNLFEPKSTSCIPREPIGDNCPIVKKNWRPGFNYTSNIRTCAGGEGGIGGIFTTPVIEYKIGSHYRLGTREIVTHFADWVEGAYDTSQILEGYGIEDRFTDTDTGDLSDTADLGNKYGCQRGITYNWTALVPGTHICSGVPPAGVSLDLNGCWVNDVTIDEKLYNGTRFFGTMPQMEYVFADSNTTCTPREGYSSGLPKCPDGNRGIYLCQNGSASSCQCYDWEAIGVNGLTLGSPIATGGKGAVANGTLIDSMGHILSNAQDFCTSEDGLNAESGNTLDFTHYPGAHACVSGGQFKDKPYGAGVIYDDKGYLSLDPDGTLADCPNYNYTGTTTISLPVAFFHKEVPLYYGEAGQAGAYKTVFARSISAMGTLKMIPGRGGQPAAQSTLADEIYNPGEDGEDTIIAYNCETGTCVNTIKAEGGKGGTSHILDKIEFRELTNEEIKNYSTGAATINLEDTLSTQSLSSQSEFSSLGFLSSISNISNDTGELLSEILGKSGDGGYVTHHCWLQPQYFVYSADHVEIPNYPTSDYEGYTNFSEGVITGLPQCTAKPGGLENQFDEEPGKPGKSGAIVIMW